jgi:hypothetical protein
VLQPFSLSDLIADWKSAARFIYTQLDTPPNQALGVVIW